MIRFRVLGAVELRDASGAELRTVLAQPKRLALLARLAVAPTRRFHSRDTLLGLFWPELDDAHARAALSQALYYLRQALGSDVIVNRGSEEIGIDFERLWCDADEFERALERGEAVNALDMYRGELLSGLFLSDTLEWEHWLEGERARLRDRATEAAWSLAETARAEGRNDEAARWGHRALALGGDEETHLRRLIALLEGVGDRAAAVRVYKEFAARLARDFELEVSPETRELIEGVRSRDKSFAGNQKSGKTSSPTAKPREQQVESAAPVEVNNEVDGSGRSRSPLLGGVAAAVSLVAIGFALLWPRVDHGSVTALPPVESPSGARIAVLPFADLSPDPGNEYLADGMTEEIISRLSELRSLRVIARTSVMPYRETEKSIAEIGRELEVGSIVEGSVRRSGDRLRVTVQLIDAKTQEHLWVEDYDGEIESILDLQREIAERVATALPVRSPVVERRRLARMDTADPEAHLLYLRGRYALASDDSVSYSRAREHFETALERDPTYAQAWSGLSDAYDRLIWARVLPPSEAYPRARAAAERALELDPGLAEAHASLGRILTGYYWDSAAAERHFRQAIELDPSNAAAHRRFAAHLRNHGRLEEARSEAEAALALDPLAFFPHFEMVLLYFFERRYDEAVEKAKDLASMGPGYPMVHFILAKLHVQKGELDVALEELDRADPGGSLAPVIATRGYIQALMGRRAEARETMGVLAARSQGAPVAFDRALVHLGLGEKDRALELIDQAIEERDWRVRLLKGEPIFDSLRSEPRFAELLQRSGFSD